MLFVERNGELWGEVENICLSEHLFVFFLNFSFSVQGEKMFLFFFLLGAMHFSSYSTSHQNPPKILLKSSQNPPNPHNKKTNKILQNITLLSSPYLHLSSLPTSQKNIKIKIKKSPHNTKYIHPKHHIKTQNKTKILNP